MKTVHLTSPVSEETLRSLDAGDSVTLSGRLFTCRSLTYDRLLDPEGGEGVRTRLKELGAQTVFHSGPLVKEHPDHVEMIAMVPHAELARGTRQDRESRRFIGSEGDHRQGNARRPGKVLQAVRLRTPGVRGQLQRIRFAGRPGHRLLLPELGRPEAMWIVEADRLGPFIVDADTKGKSLYQAIDEGFQVRGRGPAGRTRYQVGLKEDRQIIHRSYRTRH